MRVGMNYPNHQAQSSNAAQPPLVKTGQSAPAQQSGSQKSTPTQPATTHKDAPPPGTAANHPSLSSYVSARRARSRIEQGTRSSTPDLDTFREAISKLGFKVPSGIDATKAGAQAEQTSSLQPAPVQQSASQKAVPTQPATTNTDAPPAIAASHPSPSNDAPAPRAPWRTGPTVPPATQGLPAFRQALLKFKFNVPAGRDETKAWERKNGKNPGPGLVDMFRGDSKLRSVFRSKLALEQGDDASNAAIAKAEADGQTSTLFENHAVTSTKSPYVSVTSSQSAAEEKARGPSGKHPGWVTKFRLPEDLPQPNFENRDQSEHEHLVPTKIDGKFIQGQYPVKPDSSPKSK
jgi:hypothetical protein